MPLFRVMAGFNGEYYNHIVGSILAGGNDKRRCIMKLFVEAFINKGYGIPISHSVITSHPPPAGPQ